MDGDPEIRIRIREIRIFRNFFFAFFASTDLLGPQGHPPDVPESPNPDLDQAIWFFKNQGGLGGQLGQDGQVV